MQSLGAGGRRGLGQKGLWGRELFACLCTVLCGSGCGIISTHTSPALINNLLITRCLVLDVQQAMRGGAQLIDHRAGG